MPTTDYAESMSTPAVSDGRHTRSLATRAAIRRAALELVVERGLDAVTIELIADRADVGYRTFFNHFPGKEEALVDPGEERAAPLLMALRARPASESALQALRAVFVAEAASVEDREDELALRFAVLDSSPVLMRRFHAEFVVIERALVDGIAERLELDPESILYPHLLAASACTALRTAVLRWRAGGGSSRLPRGALVALVAEAFDLLAAGLPAPVTRPATASRS
jgi:AcrR family transcriptional regulator